MTADDVIAALDLKPLPFEGGWFRETHRSADTFPAAVLPARYGRAKAASTAIYYLLTPDSCSRLHRLPTDEVFHFYLGDPVRMLLLHPDGRGEEVLLGPDILNGQRVQHCVPAGVWQGSMLVDGGRFALMGTTMAPGFDLTDFAAGEQASLAAAYPAHADIIARLTTAS